MTYLFFSDSFPVEAPPYVLEGVWVHDPQFPEETITHLFHSPTARNSSYEISSTPLEIVNRQFPVFDYGIHRENQHFFNTVIPHGPTYQTDVSTMVDLYNRATMLFVKDNRGRAVFGLMDEVDFSYTKYGSTWSFKMRRAYRQEVTI
jgi:hypothetical protein